MRRKVREERARARTVLTPTGGYREGADAHTFNPAIGCGFAAAACGEFCYARGFAERQLGRGSWGERVAWKEQAPELLARELARASRRDATHPFHLDRLRVFSSSTTDPLSTPRGLELYRACLVEVAERRPARWVLQTRSPLILELEREILELSEVLVVSFTLETDDTELWRRLPPGSPGVRARQRAMEAMADWPVRKHLAVSPALPPRDPEGFADWIATYATDATVDTCTSGDGSGGSRTSRTGWPRLLETLGIDWRSEVHARELHAILVERMGPRAGWSAAGFARLAGSNPGPGPNGLPAVI